MWYAICPTINALTLIYFDVGLAMSRNIPAFKHGLKKHLDKCFSSNISVSGLMFAKKQLSIWPQIIEFL